METPRGASERSARFAVIRAALLYTPLFLLMLVVTILSALGIINAGIVLTVLAAGITFLFGYQSLQAIRDLRAELVTTTGVIGRRWSKMDLFVTRSHYISVNRNIFRLPVEDWYNLAENDRVVVTHYPHTGAVAHIEKTESAPPERKRR